MKTIVSSFAALALLCPLAQAQPDLSRFTTTWSGYITTQENDYWNIEDLNCFAGCSKAMYNKVKAELDDPANDSKPVNEITRAGYGGSRKELADISTPAGVALQKIQHPPTYCFAYGLVRQATNPLPVKFNLSGKVLTLQYEEWNQSRTVYLDGRKFPARIPTTHLGYSIGRLDGDTLVIETRGMEADIYNDFISGGGFSEQAHTTERYRVKDGTPPVLQLEISIEDPVNLIKPYVLFKQWIATPSLQLLTDKCADEPGVL